MFPIIDYIEMRLERCNIILRNFLVLAFSYFPCSLNLWFPFFRTEASLWLVIHTEVTEILHFFRPKNNSIHGNIYNLYIHISNASIAEPSYNKSGK